MSVVHNDMLPFSAGSSPTPHGLLSKERSFVIDQVLKKPRVKGVSSVGKEIPLYKTISLLMCRSQPKIQSPPSSEAALPKRASSIPIFKHHKDGACKPVSSCTKKLPYTCLKTFNGDIIGTPSVLISQRQILLTCEQSPLTNTVCIEYKLSKLAVILMKKYATRILPVIHIKDWISVTIQNIPPSAFVPQQDNEDFNIPKRATKRGTMKRFIIRFMKLQTMIYDILVLLHVVPGDSFAVWKPY